MDRIESSRAAVPTSCVRFSALAVTSEKGYSNVWLHFQVGFENDGEIKAADLQFYTNAGCTPDESELVSFLPKSNTTQAVVGVGEMGPSLCCAAQSAGDQSTWGSL